MKTSIDATLEPDKTVESFTLGVAAALSDVRVGLLQYLLHFSATVCSKHGGWRPARMYCTHTGSENAQWSGTQRADQTPTGQNPGPSTTTEHTSAGAEGF